MLNEPARRHLEPVDALGGLFMMDDVTLRQAEQDAAWALIQRRATDPEDADTLGRMLGVIV